MRLFSVVISKHQKICPNHIGKFVAPLRARSTRQSRAQSAQNRGSYVLARSRLERIEKPTFGSERSERFESNEIYKCKIE